ncbi:MAG TPA: glycosyltransferase family 87 protein [Azospirillaceae bacterium]|nr:glycosyltransferase family 87 protein [Azospirillaceae bacterium]
MTGHSRRIVPGLSALLAALLAYLVFLALGRSLPGPDLMDFGSFVASGRAAAEGQNPYGVYPLTFHVVLPNFESWNPNLNPPISVPVFAWIGQFDPHEGFRSMWAFSFVGYAVAVALLARRYTPDRWVLPVAWAFALAGFWDTLVLGQIYVPLVLATVCAWLALDRDRPVAAGVLIGIVVAVKPNFLVWPGLLFLAGHRIPALVSVATAAVLSAIPVAIYGPGIYGQWIELLASDRERAVFLTNASLSALALRAGSGTAGLALSVLVLGGMALWSWRARPAAMAASVYGLIGALLASPIAWVQYTMFLLPVFFARPLTWPMLVSAGLLVVPVPTILGYLDAPLWMRLTVGSCYGWAVVLCLVGTLAGYAGRGAGAPGGPFRARRPAINVKAGGVKAG